MARPSPKSASKRRVAHGDAISGNPGQPEIVTHGSGGGGGAGGPKKIKGPGAQANVRGGMKIRGKY